MTTGKVPQKISLEEILWSGIKHVRSSIIGSSTHTADVINTNKYTDELGQRAQIEEILIVGAPPYLIQLSKSLKGIIDTCVQIQATRFANCEEQARLLAYYLLTHHFENVNRIEIVAGMQFDHAFCVINRPEESDINDFTTFGKETWIVDPWSSKLFTGDQFPAQMTALLKQGNELSVDRQRYILDKGHTANWRLSGFLPETIPHTLQVKFDLKAPFAPEMIQAMKTYEAKRVYNDFTQDYIKSLTAQWGIMPKQKLIEKTEDQKKEAFRVVIHELSQLHRDLKTSDHFSTKENELLNAVKNADFEKIVVLSPLLDQRISVGSQSLSIFQVACEFHAVNPFNDLSFITKLIETGCDVNDPYSDECTPLTIASQYGDLALAKLLIANGANIQTTGLASPLFLAAQNGFIDLVALFIQNEARCNTERFDLSTALIAAAKNGHFDIVNLLLANKERLNLDVNAIDTHGNSALWYASFHGYDQISKELIHYGANVNQLGNNQKKPLYIACRRGYFETAKVLIENQSRNTNDDDDVLLAAFLSGNISIVNLLIENHQKLGIDLNRALDDKLPTTLAAERGYHQILDKLLKMGAKYNSDDLLSIFGDRFKPSSYDFNLLQEVYKKYHIDLPNEIKILPPRRVPQVDNSTLAYLKFSGVYNEAALQSYFKSLKTCFDQSINTLLTLKLTHGQDSAKVIYKNKKWEVIDNEGMATHFDDIESLVFHIKTAFNGDSYTCFSTTVEIDYATHQSILPTLTQWQNSAEWKTIQTVTPAKAQYLDNDGISWLILAIQDRDAETAKALVGAKADTNIPIPNTSKLLLLEAIYQKNDDIVDVLLSDPQTQINISDEDIYQIYLIDSMDNTVLLPGSIYVRNVQGQLEYTICNFNNQMYKGILPIEIPAEFDESLLESLRIPILLGIKNNYHADFEGHAPLHAAVKYKALDIFIALLKNDNTDIGKTNLEMKTAYDLIGEMETDNLSSEFLKALFSRMLYDEAANNTLTRDSAWLNMGDMIDLNFTNANGLSVLDQVMKNGNIELAHALIELGAKAPGVHRIGEVRFSAISSQISTSPNSLAEKSSNSRPKNA